MEAMLDLVFDQGYEAVTVEAIADRTGGTVTGFHQYFPDKQDCAVAILEELAEDNVRVVRSAFDREPRWPDSLRAAAYAHVRWLLDNPKKVRFGLFEVHSAGETTTALRDNLFRAYIEMVDAGREVAADPAAIPSFTAEGVVGAITQVVVRNWEKRRELDPIAQVPEMMYLAVKPYLGEKAARKELTMPPPDDRGRKGDL
jgi:AcrR family transcriptional regulator